MNKRNARWWKRRSVSKFCLTIDAISENFRCIITLAISIGVVASNPTPYNVDRNTASRVLKNMNSDVKPCDNFYQFACGGFLKSTFIPDDKLGIDTYSEIHDKLLKQLRISIEHPIEPHEPKPFRLVKKLYNYCMNQTAIENQGLEPLYKILNKLGGWPVVDGEMWDDGDFDWLKSIYKLHDIGYYADYFIDFEIGVDIKNSTKRVIKLDQASLGLSREFLSKGVDDKNVKAYYSYMVDIAVLLGAQRERASSELKESLLFEIQLANISLSREERGNATQEYNPMTLDELTKRYPSIRWHEYLTQLLPKTIKVDGNEVVIVHVPSFISDLEKLISKTRKRVQANYIMWRTVAASVTYLNDELRKRELAYWTVLSGITERAARWKECVNVVSNNLDLSVGAMYVRKYFDQSSKENVVEMVMNIRQQLNDNLQMVDWMDEKTRQSASEKIAAMSSHIGYADELLDDTKLEEFYENLELSQGHYLQAILNLTLFENEYSFSRLRKPVNKSDWISQGGPAVVNAYYATLKNSFHIPAGILQGVSFSNDRPKYMNYGAIGIIIGHEITHGFDGRGSRFDKDGNLVDWWAPSTKDKFLQKTQCIIHQYGNYTVEEVGRKLNGVITQNENIADNGGIRAAYFAYNNWVEKMGPEKKLPGLGYSPKQMFWISVANTQCTNYRSDELERSVTMDSHSPAEFRIVGPLSNIPEFSIDFNCPYGSNMNPEEKCFVW